MIKAIIHLWNFMKTKPARAGLIFLGVGVFYFLWCPILALTIKGNFSCRTESTGTSYIDYAFISILLLGVSLILFWVIKKEEPK